MSELTMTTDHHDHGPAKGIGRWVFTTNHKDIGTLYLVFSLIMFLIGGMFAFVIRAELFQPGMQLVDPNFFNQMIIMYGLVIVVIWLKKLGSISCILGWNNSARITNANIPPIKNMIRLKIRYKVPMSLWFVVNTQRPMPFAGP